MAVAAAARAGEVPAYLPLNGGESGVTDLVLVYQGATYRADGTPEQLAPFVTAVDPRRGRESWLFDGFLIIEFEDGAGHAYSTGGRGAPARQSEWIWLLDRNFEAGKGIAGLDTAVARAASRIGVPRRARKVYLTLPTPLSATDGWGTIDGRPIDFRSADDRVAACGWYVDEALRRWRARAPAHLTLAGFYWVSEDDTDGRAILPRVAEAVHARGLRLLWIPHWNAHGAAGWKGLGFDAAWQQPNHFFRPEVPAARLEQACAFARKHALGLEMEFDGRVIANAATFGPRFDAYLDSFERFKVARGSSIAYYQGSGALAEMAASKDPATRARYERLVRFVLDRQRRAANLSGRSR